MCNVDDGGGACWNSSVMRKDPRVGDNSLREFSDLLHSYGLEFTPIFDIIGYDNRRPNRPEFLLSGVNPPIYYYDIWNTEFVDWKVATIEEALSQIKCRRVGIDAIRSGREAIAEPLAAAEAVRAAFRKIEKAVDYPLLNVTNAVFLNGPIRQGIDIKQWISDKIVDEVCLFYYNNKFWPDLSGIDHSKLHALGVSYNYPKTPVAALPGPQIARAKARLLKQYPNIGSYGLFTANFYTDEHADITAAW
jgi:hypothetical protein